MRKYMSRQAFLAAVAAKEALAEAEPVKREMEPGRIGLYAGVGLTAVDRGAGAEILLASLDDEGSFAPERFSDGGLGAVNPLWAFETLANMPACIVSVLEVIKGESAIYAPFEDGAAQALREAAAALGRGLIDLAVVLAADTPDDPANLTETAVLGHLRPSETVSAAAAALVLARAGDAGLQSPVLLGDFELRRIADSRPDDPLAPLIGRTMAAAPLVLAVLATAAPELFLKTSMTCSLGHFFSFKAFSR
jgi:3-oxoacyl-(acyl-carrier-protein) synthase